MLGQAINIQNHNIVLDELSESSKNKEGDEMNRFSRVFFLTFFILTISAPSLLAGVAVPEIDPSLAPSVIALITGGLLILKSKSWKNNK
jgi:hypothetical protein